MLEKVFALDADNVGFTVAIAILGTIAGVFAVGRPSDWLGRKNMLFFVAICYLVSSLGCGLARNWHEFLAARFLGGVAVGATSVVMPMYIAEISPPNVRRTAGDGEPVQYRFRHVAVQRLELPYRPAPCLFSPRCSPEVSWRWMLGILAVPSAIFFLLVFAIPESPRGLVMRGRLDDARKTLERLGEPGD